MKVRFSPENYAKSDQFAKNIGIKVLSQLNKYEGIYWDSVEENSNKYGVDLLLKKNGVLVGYAECEQSYNWKSGKFPFSDTRIVKRKNKYLRYPLPVFFIRVSESGDGLLIYSAGKINTHGYDVAVSNYRNDGEVMRTMKVGKENYIKVQC